MNEPSVTIKRQHSCAACGRDELTQVLDLPRLPMIGIFLDSLKDADRFPPFDQAMMICGECGHMQLRDCLDPKYLYDESFTHRSSASASASSGNEFFAAYLQRVAGDRRFKRAIEIGCNDVQLLKLVSPIGDIVCGVDPIWRGCEPEPEGNIRVIGAFVEDIDFHAELDGAPDLIFSSMTFEHLAEPKETLERLIEVAADDALFVIQVPGTDFLLDNCRFDQISHQHYHQFTLASFCRMINEAGGIYLDHAVNYGYWGAILVAFRKGGGKKESPAFRKAIPSLVSKCKAHFDTQIDNCLWAIRDAGTIPVYGYGAGQCLPILAYFMDSDLGFMRAILDDDPARQHKYYPGLAVKTVNPEPEMQLEKATVVLTAPDYARPLIQRISALGAKKIVLPIMVL